MKFKIFISVFIFLFLVLTIGYFTEKTAGDESGSAESDIDEDDDVEENEPKSDEQIPSEKSAVAASVVDSHEVVETSDSDAKLTVLDVKQMSDSDSQKSADSDVETADSDQDSAAEVACLPEDTRYVQCDHVAGKLQKQSCNDKKVWEDDNDCFEKPPVAEMVSLSSGSFWMGSTTTETGRKEDEVRHFVQLSQGYALGKYEVTQGLFKAVLGYNSSHFSQCGNECPVENISYNEALHYANELSKIVGNTPCFDCHGKGASVVCTLKEEYNHPSECSGYRLPTEAEWEFAVRAGTTTPLYNKRVLATASDSSSVSPIAWFMNNSSVSYDGGYDCHEWFDGAEKCGTQPHGKKVANDFDLYDMLGNVGEWTMDSYQKYADGTEDEPLVNPFVHGSSLHTVRGGSWADLATSCRSAARSNLSASSKNNKVGFRLAKTE
ncbi:SUMF1/EgtB/PvdO family nonheme iron enzyme [bacterium]|nr:SUMF1/EgtB/PvdO family nonheme iron enzyme [bacterium]